MTAIDTRPGWPSSLSLLRQQFRHQGRIFWRTPINAFFTIAFPLMFLVLFSLLFDDIDTRGGTFSAAQFYAPSLAVFAAASATYTNLAINVSLQRDRGALKRVRGTPLPPWIFLGGVISSAIWIAALASTLMLAIGVVVYDLSIDVERLPAAAVSFVVGVSAFAALGLALSALVKTGEAAPMAAQATLLPMAFVSDVFIPLNDPPRWLDVVGDYLPLKPFVESFSLPFSPFADGSAFLGRQLLVMAAWAIIGLIVASKKFTWEPGDSNG